MGETKQSKSSFDFNLKPFDVVCVIAFVVLCVVNVTVPLWAKQSSVGVYPTHMLSYFIINGIWAALIITYVLVAKKGGDEDVD